MHLTYSIFNCGCEIFHFQYPFEILYLYIIFPYIAFCTEKDKITSYHKLAIFKIFSINNFLNRL